MKILQHVTLLMALCGLGLLAAGDAEARGCLRSRGCFLQNLLHSHSSCCCCKPACCCAPVVEGDAPAPSEVVEVEVEVEITEISPSDLIPAEVAPAPTAIPDPPRS